MEWLTRDNILLVAGFIAAILGIFLPQYRDGITEFIDAFVKFLFVILFPDMVYRSVNVYYAAKVQLAKIQAQTMDKAIDKSTEEMKNVSDPDGINEFRY